ncbi:hypothetical protein B0H14DRAFT_3432747 [Mycena olivaceomarginata]|nr:hypothetical protein B0H14DRAFT_3432747 [Mycena olivaceomarginata]
MVHVAPTLLPPSSCPILSQTSLSPAYTLCIIWRGLSKPLLCSNFTDFSQQRHNIGREWVPLNVSKTPRSVKVCLGRYTYGESLVTRRSASLSQERAHGRIPLDAMPLDTSHMIWPLGEFLRTHDYLPPTLPDDSRLTLPVQRTAAPACSVLAARARVVNNWRHCDAHSPALYDAIVKIRTEITEQREEARVARNAAARKTRAEKPKAAEPSDDTEEEEEEGDVEEAEESSEASASEADSDDIFPATVPIPQKRLKSATARKRPALKPVTNAKCARIAQPSPLTSAKLHKTTDLSTSPECGGNF